MTVKKILRRCLTVLSYVCVIALVAALAAVLYFNMSGQVTFVAGKTAMWVRTDSMEPAIEARSYILVEKATAADVQVGDVIVFRSDDPALRGAYNTHRVTAIVGDHEEFVTKGDHNVVEDKYTAKAGNVVGIYRKNLQILTFFGRFFSTSMGIIVTITLILAFVAIAYLPDMISATRERTKKLEAKKQQQIEERVRQEVERLRAEGAVVPQTAAADEKTAE